MAGKKNLYVDGTKEQQVKAGKQLKVSLGLGKSNAAGTGKEASAANQEPCPCLCVPENNGPVNNRDIFWEKRKKSHGINISFHKHFSEMNATERIFLLARLPVFAPRPVCEFTINGVLIIGRYEKTEKLLVYIRTFPNRKPIRIPISMIESVNVIKY